MNLENIRKRLVKDLEKAKKDCIKNAYDVKNDCWNPEHFKYCEGDVITLQLDLLDEIENLNIKSERKK